MRIDKLDIVCRAICAFGYLEARVENITQLPDEARLRVDWHGQPFLLYYGWRECPVKYNGQPGSEKRQAHERFERLMKLAEDRGGHGIVWDFLQVWDASQRREFIACAGASERVEMACLVFYMIGRPGWKTACTRILRKLAKIYEEDAP